MKMFLLSFGEIVGSIINRMDIQLFCRALPKVELHAHLNGSLSPATLLHLKRYHADRGLQDKTNAFFDEFQIGSGDTKNLSDCFQVFNIAHALTSTPEALSMATTFTLNEFQEDGCCYIELRSTPRATEHMTKRKYLETIVQAMQNLNSSSKMISRLIISINRAQSVLDAEEISNLAIEFYKLYPDIVVGIEISGNPMVGKFEDFIPSLSNARAEGLKVSLHCGEVCHPVEVLQMLCFNPDRIGHGICIHPSYGGTDEAWSILNQKKIPVEICLTSNVKTKSTPDYEAHHFKKLNESQIPFIICTDDKGVFATSLSQEYRLCSETFKLTQSELAKISLDASQHIFANEKLEIVKSTILKFIKEHNIKCYYFVLLGNSILLS